MTLSELKLEHQKVVSIRDSLLAAAMPDAAKAVDIRLLSIRQAMEQQKPTPQLLVEATAKVRCLAQAKAKAAAKIEQLQLQLTSAQEEAMELQRCEQEAKQEETNIRQRLGPSVPEGQLSLQLSPDILARSAEALHAKFACAGAVPTKQELVGLLQTVLTEARAAAPAVRCPAVGEQARGADETPPATQVGSHVSSQGAPGTPSVLWTMHASANARSWAEVGEDCMDDGDSST